MKRPKASTSSSAGSWIKVKVLPMRRRGGGKGRSVKNENKTGGLLKKRCVFFAAFCWFLEGFAKKVYISNCFRVFQFLFSRSQTSKKRHDVWSSFF